MNTKWTNDRHLADILNYFLYIPGELGQWYGYWLFGSFVASSSSPVNKALK